MKPMLFVFGTTLFWLNDLALSAADKPPPPSFAEYLRQSAVPREVIDRFLKGPSWTQFDSELGYVLGNYLPQDGMDGANYVASYAVTDVEMWPQGQSNPEEGRL